MSNNPNGPYDGLSKEEQVELIWEDIEEAERERDSYLSLADEAEWRMKELKAELHDIQMGVL